ncbi:MAG: guanylate kinase [Candidatus Omnitrophica bacterium]|nr:guanylate kinase [Candidatus Omnitrophota bacterium]
MNRRGKIFVISGPSGSGKTTLAAGLFKDKFLRRKIIRSISYTTRPKRTQEKHSRHYFFISEPDFKLKLKAKKILEWTKYLGYYYATPKEFIEKKLKESKGIVLCLDLKGALKIKKLYPKEAVTIFIVPPSVGILKKRIAGRCSKTSAKEIRGRLMLARKEMACKHKYGYRVVNNDLTKALDELKGIIHKEISNNN